MGLRYCWEHEKQYLQLAGRHGAGYVRHLLTCIREQTATVAQVAEELALTARWVRQLYGRYLRAGAEGMAERWRPGRSGGGRLKAIPVEVAALWRKLLTADPPASYSFAASESLRRCAFVADRAIVRRWALRANLAHPAEPRRPSAPVRRWQCQAIGALWQLDVTSHAWFGPEQGRRPLFDMLDDCSRVITGARLYPHEDLLAYLDFLRRTFEAYGLPLALYVDYHSFFFSYVPDTLTYLGACLRFCDVSFRYAPTPQAKGKIERHHQFWQQRLPAYFAAEQIRQLEVANPHIEQLRLHHNQQEVHREIQMPPQTAWERAQHEHRSQMRPCLRWAWWPYLWTVRTLVKVGLDQCVPAGVQRIKLSFPVGTRLTRCEHPDGAYTFLANQIGRGGRPIVVLRLEAPPHTRKF
jgi:hypothetical protein